MKNSVENSKIKKLTTPFPNLNGNSKEGLLIQLISIWSSFNEPIKMLAKSEYDHPRNAIDSKHYQKMRDEKMQMIKELRHFQSLFNEMINELKSKH